MKFSLCFFACLFFSVAEIASAQNARRIAVLPFSTIGVDSVVARTSGSILRAELARSGRYIPLEEGDTPTNACADMDCAIRAVSGMRVDHVMYGKLSKLGSKIIVDYVVADVATRKSLALGGLSAASVEDLERVLRSIAATVVDDRPVTPAVADTPVFVASRALNAPPYNSYVGVGVGQLYPTGGYDGDRSRSFVLDIRTLFDYQEYGFVLLGSWRLGPMVHFGASYYLSQGNFAPYIGGGLGYHFVYPSAILDMDLDDYSSSSGVTGRSGFQGMVNAGFSFLHMGDLRLFTNLDYMITADGFGDQALVLTIGAMGAANLRF